MLNCSLWFCSIWPIRWFKLSTYSVFWLINSVCWRCSASYYFLAVSSSHLDYASSCDSSSIYFLEATLSAIDSAAAFCNSVYFFLKDCSSSAFSSMITEMVDWSPWTSLALNSYSFLIFSWSCATSCCNFLFSPCSLSYWALRLA